MGKHRDIPQHGVTETSPSRTEQEIRQDDLTPGAIDSMAEKMPLTTLLPQPEKGSHLGNLKKKGF